MALFKTEPAKFADDRSGASLIEYSLLIGLITVTIMSLVSGIGSWLVSAWEVLTSAITQ